MTKKQGILNVKDIAEIFSIDRITVYNWRNKGILPLFRIGGKLFAKQEDIQKLINEKTSS